MKRHLLALASWLLVRAALAADDGQGTPSPSPSPWRMTGSAAMGARLYQHPDEPGRESHRAALRLSPEWRWADGAWQFVASPVLDAEGAGNGRSQVGFDALHVAARVDGMSFKAGLSKLFWGVTESRHLVDVVNPPDLAHHYAAEQRLATAMLYLALPTPAGQLETLLLPWERDPRFPGPHGRPRTALPIGGEVNHPNGRPPAFATRLTVSRGDFDAHLYFFRGLDRETVLTVRPRPQAPPNELAAVRRLVRQWGADLQVPVGNLLVKSEMTYRSGYSHGFLSGVAGGEYAMSGIGGSVVDVTLLGEYQFDRRPADAPLTALRHGAYAGVRVALNDPDSTEFKFGVIVETATGARVWRADGSRRVATNWTVEAALSVFQNARGSAVLQDYRRDGHVEILARYHFQ